MKLFHCLLEKLGWAIAGFQKCSLQSGHPSGGLDTDKSVVPCYGITPAARAPMPCTLHGWREIVSARLVQLGANVVMVHGGRRGKTRKLPS